MDLFKITAEDGRAHHGGTGRWQKGKWRSVKGDIEPCRNGLHLCRRQDVVSWLGPVIWRAEYDGELVEADSKVVVRRARVVERFATWNERTSRLFAADCAERGLPLFEKASPNDSRPRDALAVVRRYADGKATKEELTAAGDAAWAAAWDAARAAAGAAARAAAGDAARAAAWDAARAAAGAAAWAAARDAAWAAETKWQTDRLFDYLEGRAS